jgi:serine/threonine protein kinase
MPETLRGELWERRAASETVGDPEADPRLPPLQGLWVGDFHSLHPLDDPARGKSGRHLGAPTSLYRCISEGDGELYALRRVDAPAAPVDALARAQSWMTLAHPNVVRLHSVFTSDEMTHVQPGGAHTYFVYAYHPKAETLEHAHFVARSVPLDEEAVWAVALQLLQAMHAVHGMGMAVRGLEPSHVLLTDRHTVRLSCTAILDVLRPERHRPLQQLQADDLQALGSLYAAAGLPTPGQQRPPAPSAVGSRVPSPPWCAAQAPLPALPLAHGRVASGRAEIDGLCQRHLLR